MTAQNRKRNEWPRCMARRCQLTASGCFRRFGFRYGSRGSTPGGAGESMAPFLVNTQDFLARRQAVVAELRAAKEEAQAEHRRLQAKIRQRLGVMAY